MDANRIHDLHPREPLAVAIKYALSLWPRVMRYTEEGHYLIDSNPVEQGQRPQCSAERTTFSVRMTVEPKTTQSSTHS